MTTGLPEEEQSEQTTTDRRVASILRGSLHEIISEDDFKKPLEENVRPFFAIAGLLLHKSGNYSARFYYNLMSEAEKLETFLDDHGARQNKTWYYFSELIASIRNFGVAAFELSHVLNRYGDYYPKDPHHFSEEFLTHGIEVMDFFTATVHDLLVEALEEMKRRGCKVPEVVGTNYHFGNINKTQKLPRNIAHDQHTTSESNVLRMAETFRKVAIKIGRDRYGNRYEPDELDSMIPNKVNETKVKVLENALHNIQSEYDTHVRQTEKEKQDPDLILLRASISVSMHLLEMARWVIHFYERHESQIHQDESRNNISNIVSKDMVLKVLSHFAFYYIHRHIMEGKPVAERIMSGMVRMQTVELPVPKPAGFHARPAYYITLVVEEHGTDVFLLIGNRKFDARSVLDLLEAGGMAADMELETVTFQGDERTLADLKVLAECNYCENENIPKELNYIRVARNIMT